MSQGPAKIQGLTDPQLRATPVPVSGTVSINLKSFNQPTISAINSSGNTELVAVITPGNVLRLYWFGLIADPDNTAKVIAALRWGTGGANFVMAPLSQYGGILAHNYKSGSGYVQGPVNASLVLNLSAAQTVYPNLDIEEITP